MSARVRCLSCNSEWPATIGKCYKCGVPLGAGAATSSGQPADIDDREVQRLLRRVTLGTAGEVDVDADADAVDNYGAYGPRRDGSRLVMVEGCAMPRRCPICNTDDVDEPTELSFRRSSKQMGGVSGMFQAGADALAGWNYTGPVEVTVYFCSQHRTRFRNRLLVGGGIALAAILYLVVAYWRSEGLDVNAGPPTDVLLAVAAAIGGVMMLVIYAANPALTWFRPRKFVDRSVWVTGAGREFLDSISGSGRG